MARPSTTRIDTNHDFIIYKTQSIKMNSSSQTGNKGRASSVQSRDLIQSRYNVDFDSVLAFGGMRRKHKKSKKSAESEELRDLDSYKESCSSSVSSRSSSSVRSSMLSTLYDPDDWSEWATFRMKYEAKHKRHGDSHLYGGRYGVGRGYVEYKHRHDCDGSCRGVCLGK